jgi:hypothetical protein
MRLRFFFAGEVFLLAHLPGGVKKEERSYLTAGAHPEPQATSGPPRVHLAREKSELRHGVERHLEQGFIYLTPKENPLIEPTQRRREDFLSLSAHEDFGMLLAQAKQRKNGPT